MQAAAIVDHKSLYSKVSIALRSFAYVDNVVNIGGVCDIEAAMANYYYFMMSSLLVIGCLIS